jgi:hypothetical protein
MSAIEIVNEIPKEEQTAVLAIQEQARALTVRTQEELDYASSLLRDIKTRRGALEDKRKEMKTPILEAGKQVDGLFKPIIEELDAAERVIKVDKIQPYLTEQERIRREAERQAQEAAERERKRLADLAAKRAAEGKEAKAEEFQARADQVPVPFVPPTVTAPKGLSQRDNWTAVMVDMMEIIQAAASGNALAASMLEFNQTEANRKAKALTNSVTVPGVRFVNRPVLAQSK